MRLPRASRVVHGTMGGDADFEVCLPVEGWNSKLIVWALAIWLRHWEARPAEPAMADVGARLPDGSVYRLGQERGAEHRWEATAPGCRRILAERVAGTAVTGELRCKMVAFANLAEDFSPPSTDRAYQRLVWETGSGERVVLYLGEGGGHRHGLSARLDPAGEPTGFWPEALRTLDRWVVRGEPPEEIAGISPR